MPANYAPRANFRIAARCSGSAMATVLALASAGVAHAQSVDDAPTPAPVASKQTPADDIVVTGTRILRDGYKAPTPTTVIDAAQIAAKAPANIADFVNEIPAVVGSTTPTGYISGVSTGLVGINALNLRALGATRTLVLLDGQRFAPSTLTGLADINTIPQGLVKRVDVVTGGASAEWGSDAVAGVVNFVLDKDFTGLKGTVQGGVTDYGDDRSYTISLSAGMKFADGRGHILLNGEVAHSDGIRGIGNRKWYQGAKLVTNPNYTPTNGEPQLLALDNVGFATATPGGIIDSGPLKGTYFGADGTPAMLNFGSIVSGNLMQGGDWQYADYGTTGDLDPAMSRQNVFGRVSFDATDNLQLFAQASYNRSTSWENALYQFNFANLTIQPDNAFIPASIAASITQPFTLGTLNYDLGPGVATTDRSAFRFAVGASGSFSALGSDWTWDAHYQNAINHIYTDVLTSITARYKNAIDAVRNSNGVVVCRSTLTNPDDGCVPYDIFGTGVNTDAARNYVLGTSWGRTRLTQSVAAATLHGSPFSTWAGLVSIAMGIEHRREGVSGSNDPLSTTRSYFVGNFRATSGSYTVTEGFLETVVPLARDLPFIESLDLNAAVRATDYSTSGYVTTWKIGATYKPISDLTFRFTRSRDIRAPNLAELFTAGSSATSAINDPFRGNAATTVAQTTTGNLALKPEVADTLGFGGVFQPHMAPGLAFSVDYYNIDIKDAISTVNAATLVNQCYLGNTGFCSQITRDSTGVVTAVLIQPTNLAKQISRGIDFEASYRRNVLGGNLTLRGLATRFLKNYSSDGITAPTDNVGTNSNNSSLRNSLPKWRYLASIGYDRDPVNVQLTARGFSSGVYNTSYIECASGCPASSTAHMTINNNRLPGAVYFDAYVAFKLTSRIESFLSVDNLANKKPATVAYGPTIGAAPLDANPLLYDVIGRSFRIGIRFNM
jgi:outer membrane receptor protein involved in Fe transport